VDEASTLREQMVLTQLERRDIRHLGVLHALGNVPRHLFVDGVSLETAYADHPIPIGSGQTISQPYIVALMTQLIDPQPHFRVLDVGTGSGYQAAVLAELVAEVYSVEIIELLAQVARTRLNELYSNVHVSCVDGGWGLPDQAPFDAIICAAAAKKLPQELLAQLSVGGRLVIPVESPKKQAHQQLLLFEKRANGTIQETNIGAVSFVPLTGETQTD
jgi:protein-L-isoaspartate(D-aspartate) O-methyltransferase